MNIKLYKLVCDLRDRIELADEKGVRHSDNAITEAVKKINEVNTILDRRAK